MGNAPQRPSSSGSKTGDYNPAEREAFRETLRKLSNAALAAVADEMRAATFDLLAEANRRADAGMAS